MRMAWTKEQLDAINLEGKNIIVSAGAGSGKTAVLTERVLRKLKSGVHINELLVLTFTNAAAAEMKERIRKAINKTPNLEEESNLIDGAYITTFDSFALSIVKKYHTKLNITNNIKITDEVIIDIEKNKILDTIMDEKYLLLKPSFTKLIQNFCLKDDKELKKYILNIYKKIELKYDKESFLEDYINDFYNEEKINSLIDEYLMEIKKQILEIKKLLISLNDYFDGDFITKMEDAYSKLLNATTYEEIRNNLDIKIPRIPKDSPEEGKKIKTTISKITSNIKDFCIYEATSEMKEELLETKETAEELISILKQLDKRLTRYKEKNNIYNFTDISRLAIKVVDEDKDIREELTTSFNEILIDEYQDTSDTQEKFISLISKNNVYMVGDIKQSIYRFRNANPYIFKNKYDTYRDTDQGIKIDLVKNFRSRKEVLENINLLFDLFMDDEIGGADYKASHRMVFGNNTYLEEGKTSQDYNLDVLTYEESKKTNITKEEQEIFIIANDIKEKVESGYQIFDKDTLVLRPITYSDFVILLDKSRNFNLYKKIFEYLHIPLTILKDESIKKDQDVLVIKNLLKLIICIKNKIFDTSFKYAYTSVARSFLYKLKDDEIYNYFVKDNFKESTLYNKCLELSKSIDIKSPKEFLDYILDEFDYDKKLLTIGNIKSFRIRREYFYNLVSSFEEGGNTIYDFVTYLDEIFDKDYDLKFSIREDNSNSCKIMTIHKSKGLEFPICYFAGFSSKFNITELKEKIIFDNKYGIVLPKVDEYYKDTILKKLLKITTKKEEISERIRLLYVAVTRAKEKMIFVIPEQEETEEVRDIVSLYEREKYNSFLSIMKSIYTILLPHTKKCNLKYSKDYLYSLKEQNNNNLLLDKDHLKVEELNIEASVLEESRYSKDSLHLITKEEQTTMDFGTKIHEVLEQINFKDRNLEDFDIDANMKQKINSFLDTNLIRENINNKMYKEYEFTYQEEDRYFHGIIDLMIDTPNKMIIIDYKLKNIEDDAYLQQLNGYRKVIEKKTKKEVDCYLYSIMNEEFKKVI